MRVGLIELKGWGRIAMPGEDERALQIEIAARLAELGVVGGCLGEGRYGVLIQASLDPTTVAARLETAARATSAGRPVKAIGVELTPVPAAMEAHQIARALHFTLLTFVRRGLPCHAGSGHAGSSWLMPPVRIGNFQFGQHGPQEGK